jgi:hypothetical protein
MIFPVIKLEDIVQVGDQTRLDARKSYTTPDEAAITLIEIEPDTGLGFLDITSSSHLDYQYSTDGTKTISLRVTTDGSPETVTKTLEVITETDDKLFSTDEELTPHEPDILEYVRPGRNSFLNVHRTAQDRILTWLDEHRITDNDGGRLTKAAIVDTEEVNDWSKFMVLRLVFEGLSNSTDDIFHAKALRYRELEAIARNRSQLRLDKDGDGETDKVAYDTRTFRLVRK